jgi:pyruvate/2-oxoglutarate dehydrogenase complex dihydrolipoamide acyltransferase (E2) component
MIETDKVTIPVNAPCDGTLVQQHAQVGETVAVGGDLFTLESALEKTLPTIKPPSPSSPSQSSPSPRTLVNEDSPTRTKADDGKPTEDQKMMAQHATKRK